MQDGTLGVGAVDCRSVLKTGGRLVSVTVQVKLSVSVTVPSLTVTSTVWTPRAGEAEGAADRRPCWG